MKDFFKKDTNTNINTKQNKTVYAIAIIFCFLMVMFVCIVLVFEVVAVSVFGVNRRINDKINSDWAVHYMYVGQGDSVLIKLPNGQTILIDGGPIESGNTTANYLLEQDLIIDKIDWAILTHPDSDHSGGFVEILDKYSVGTFFRPNVKAVDSNNTAWIDPGSSLLGADVYTKSTQSYRDSITAIYRYSDRVVIHKKEKIELKDSISSKLWSFEIYPYGEFEFAKKVDNNYSPIMVLTISGKRFLFMGDAEGKVCNEFMNDIKKNDITMNNKTKTDIDNLEINVIMLAHHGSHTNDSNNIDFLDFAMSKLRFGMLVLASSGLNNSYGHPSGQVLDRLSELGVNSNNVLRTDKYGSVSIGVDNEDNIVFNYSLDTNMWDNVLKSKSRFINSAVLILITILILTPIIISIEYIMHYKSI